MPRAAGLLCLLTTTMPFRKAAEQLVEALGLKAAPKAGEEVKTP